jgi:hypothetical protein
VDFITDYVGLLDQVRGSYPSADIFCVSWEGWGAENQAHVGTAIAMFGDPRVYEVQFTIDSQDGFGCDYHPSAVTHQKLGAQLAQEITATLGL